MRKGGKGMGLFSRKECDVCKKKLSLAEGLKCLDGSICSECKKKMSPLFTDYKNTPIEKIKEHLVYREENKSRVKVFVAAETFGEYPKVMVDRKHNWFVVTKVTKLSDENPDVFDLSDIQNVLVEIEENKRELHFTNKKGKTCSYKPARYEFTYQFKVNIQMNHPFIKMISLKITKEDVKIISEMQDKEVMVQSNEKYQESLQVANALKDALES